ncbi:MAG: hypothetical protein A2X36_12690 [Elusimicrobia bacterium GWA2_69_24]|nr:MAG: hypothetical protein A2X36_12690 [Elusimicrobia bacterium GWA2_69_24]HBL16854.1 DNA mismatch repair endonuclease MutL [Elusimicrobiota bacterium]
MPVVRLLPPDVVSRIAAGEVIDRPASVLKELIENSLDAGAARIAVETLGAGRELLRIADDGRGMEPADCRSAFERHATSKIADFSDLDSLCTFGFRGEALFAVAAVSKVTLTSRAAGSRKGWRVELRGGRLVSEREAPPSEGTVIEVRDLFFNTPARAKFLKSDASERSHLARVVEEAALANPGVSFSLKSEGRGVLRFDSHAAGGAAEALRLRACEVLGPELGRGMLAAEAKTDGVELLALLSAADSLQATRSLQYVLVNRRPVANRTVQQALYRAYEPFRAKNRHPAAVLCLTVPPDQVDVNVHPTKREVRFRKEQALYELIARAASRTLLTAKGIPTLLPQAGRGSLPPARQPEFPAPRLHEAAHAYAPAFHTASGGARPAAPERPREEAGWFPQSLRYLGQIERSYLAFENDGGLLVVDQHAAQERVLFEKYLGQILSGEVPVQDLLLPIPVELPASAVHSLLGLRKRLKKIGFSVEPFGKSLQVLSVPAVFQKSADVKDVVHGLLEGLLSPAAAAADARYDATATIACKASVKAHDSLSPAEAVELLASLRRCADPSCCPHGRPTMLNLDRAELARRFKRSGAPPL